MSDINWTELEALQENWDGEGAPPPSAECIALAEELVAKATGHLIYVRSVDADVLGGVGVYFHHVWVSFHNDGQHTVTFEVRGEVHSRSYAYTPWKAILNFIIFGRLPDRINPALSPPNPHPEKPEQ